MKNIKGIVTAATRGSVKRLWHMGKKAWWFYTTVLLWTLGTVIASYALGFGLARYGVTHEPAATWDPWWPFAVTAVPLFLLGLTGTFARMWLIRTGTLEADPEAEAKRPARWPWHLGIAVGVGAVAELLNRFGLYETGRGLMQLSSMILLLGAVLAQVGFELLGALYVFVTGKVSKGFKLLPEVTTPEMKSAGQTIASALAAIAFMSRIVVDGNFWRHPALHCVLLAGFGLLILADRAGWLPSNSLRWLVPLYGGKLVVVSLVLALVPRTQVLAADGAKMLGQPEHVAMTRLLIQKEQRLDAIWQHVPGCGGHFCEDEEAEAKQLAEDIRALKEGTYCVFKDGCKKAEAVAEAPVKKAADTAALPPPPAAPAFAAPAAPQGLRFSPTVNLPPPPVLSGQQARSWSVPADPGNGRLPSFDKDTGPRVVSQPRVRRTIVAVNGY